MYSVQFHYNCYPIGCVLLGVVIMFISVAVYNADDTFKTAEQNHFNSQL